MNRLFMVLVLGLSFAAVLSARADDRVWKNGEKKAWNCEIKGMTPDTITIDRSFLCCHFTILRTLVGPISKDFLDSLSGNSPLWPDPKPT